MEPDGGFDATFDVGLGANGPVRSLAARTDGDVLAGGSFSSFDGAPAPGLVRLRGDGTAGASYVGFASTIFAASEDSGAASLQIVRSGAVTGQVTLTLTVTNASGSSGFLPPPANLTFAPGEAVQTIPVPLLDNCVTEGTKDATLLLTGANDPGCIVRGAATLRLFDDETAGSPDQSFVPALASPPLVNALLRQPDGRWLIAGVATALHRHIARLNADGSLDPTFETNSEPFLAPFREAAALVVQPDGRILIAGSFARTNASFAGSNFLARLNSDGSWDPSFDAKLRPSDQGVTTPLGIFALALQPDGRILAGGGTPLSQGQISRSVLARFLPDGQLDTTYLTPFLSARPSPVVRALALLPGGQILAGGAFVTQGSAVRTNLARLQTNGFVAPAFSASVGGEVYCLAAFPDGRVLAGGSFSNAAFFGSNALQRLLPNGSPDTTFATRVDGAVRSCVLLRDGRVLIGGTFSQVNGLPRRSLARLLPNGDLDPAFDPGAGPDDTVAALVPLPDGTVMAGGWFSKMNGAPRRGVALLSAGDAPILSVPPPGAGGQVSLQIVPRPGCPHVLERSTDLRIWSPVTTNASPTAQMWRVDLAPEPEPGGFYRVRRGAW